MDVIIACARVVVILVTKLGFKMYILIGQYNLWICMV